MSLTGILSFGPKPEEHSGPSTGPRSNKGTPNTTRRPPRRLPFHSSLEAHTLALAFWPHQPWPHFPARALAPYLTSAEMNMGPIAIIHARATGLFHPNQPHHTLLLFRLPCLYIWYIQFDSPG